MSDGRIYLDHNATTPLRPQARAAMVAALDLVGAAASVHGEGRAARALVERARAQVAALVGVDPQGVVFTSGATEANNMALSADWQRRGQPGRLDRLLVSQIEHACVLEGGRFAKDRTKVLPVTRDGVVDEGFWTDAIEAAGATGERPLVSLMLANNETGVIQPVRAMADAARRSGGLSHTDAAQALGKMPVSARALGVDLLTVSSHKVGGPVGVGALIVAGEGLHLTDRLMKGGGQERGWRAGTENLPAIAGFGAAAAALLAEADAEIERVRALRDRLEARLLETPGATLFGAGQARLPNTTNLAVEGVPAETSLIALDLAGLAVSSGAACTSGKVRSSHVLAAMGVEERLARSALRLSLGWSTTAADVDNAAQRWRDVFAALHRRQHERAA